jgi:hypothetical protein
VNKINEITLLINNYINQISNQRYCYLLVPINNQVNKRKKEDEQPRSFRVLYENDEMLGNGKP